MCTELLVEMLTFVLEEADKLDSLVEYLKKTKNYDSIEEKVDDAIKSVEEVISTMQQIRDYLSYRNREIVDEGLLWLEKLVTDLSSFKKKLIRTWFPGVSLRI